MPPYSRKDRSALTVKEEEFSSTFVYRLLIIEFFNRLFNRSLFHDVIEILLIDFLLHNRLLFIDLSFMIYRLLCMELLLIDFNFVGLSFIIYRIVVVDMDFY